jgi:hypothetical protein
MLMRYRDQNGQGWARCHPLASDVIRLRGDGLRERPVKWRANGEPAPIAPHPEALPERLIKQVRLFELVR